MPNKQIVTWYEIKEVSPDGLIKDAKSPYGSSVFYGMYSTMDEVDKSYELWRNPYSLTSPPCLVAMKAHAICMFHERPKVTCWLDWLNSKIPSFL
jgi:hypothetical protein